MLHVMAGISNFFSGTSKVAIGVEHKNEDSGSQEILIDWRRGVEISYTMDVSSRKTIV